MIGDYFNRNGVWLGTDGKKDGKVYFATEIGRRGDDVDLDRRSIRKTTIEAVRRARDQAVQLTTGNEYEAIHYFATMGDQAASDTAIGTLKGIGNSPVHLWNGLSQPGGLLGGLLGVPNPFSATPFFTPSNEREAVYENAGSTGTITGLSFAAAPFAATGAPSVVPQTARVGQFEVGAFSVVDWTGYPEGYLRPSGTFRLLQGDEYANARLLANKTNRTLRSENPGMFKDAHIHEIKPVKFGGSPTDPANKVVIPRSAHEQQFTPWWNQLQRDLQK